MKHYEGIRIETGCLVHVNGRPLDPRHDLRNHSPDGFEWGYGGSGPAQLSLAILADALEDDETALTLYQEFKREFVAQFEHKEWQLTEAHIRTWIYETLIRRDDRAQQLSYMQDGE